MKPAIRVMGANPNGYVLAADVFDATALAAESSGGIGHGSVYTYDARGCADGPCCGWGHALWSGTADAYGVSPYAAQQGAYAANASDLRHRLQTRSRDEDADARRALVRAFPVPGLVSDAAVAAVLRARGLGDRARGRITFRDWCEALGVERGA